MPSSQWFGTIGVCLSLLLCVGCRPVTDVSSYSCVSHLYSGIEAEKKVRILGHAVLQAEEEEQGGTT